LNNCRKLKRKSCSNVSIRSVLTKRLVRDCIRLANPRGRKVVRFSGGNNLEKKFVSSNPEEECPPPDRRYRSTLDSKSGATKKSEWVSDGTLQSLIEWLLAFGTRFPAAVYPEPLIGILPYIVFYHFGEFLRVGDDVGFEIAGTHQFDCRIEAQPVLL